MTRAQKIALQQRQDFAELMKHYPFTTETLAGEEWRDIEGYGGKYQISNYGRLKRVSIGNKHVKIMTPCLSNCGYMLHRINKGNQRFYYKTHRLVAKVFIPNPNNKPQVNHIDGIKWNACVTNLEWVTREENMQHADNTGLRKHAQGEQWCRTKLTNKQALYARENPHNLTSKQLAEKFEVSEMTINLIQRGLTYRCAGGKFRVSKKKYLSSKDKEKIRHLYQTGEYTQKQLSKMFDVSHTAIVNSIKDLIQNLPHEGHLTKNKIKLNGGIREKIRAEYVKGSKEFGTGALAKKYNIGYGTAWEIINEK